MSIKRVRSRNFYAWSSELDHLLWSSGTPTARAAKYLGRTARTVHDWRNGKRPVPRWALRLLQFLLYDRYEQWRVDLFLARHRAENGVFSAYSPSLLAHRRGSPPPSNRGGNSFK